MWVGLAHWVKYKFPYFGLFLLFVGVGHEKYPIDFD